MLFDTVAVVASEAGVTALLGEAVAWVHDAFAHLKFIAYTTAAQPLLDAAGVAPDAVIVALATVSDAATYAQIAGNGRIWTREASVRTVF